jgi:hypothetical protein
MYSIRFLMAVLLLTPVAGIWRAGAPTPGDTSDECPRISVTCPTSFVRQGEPLTFTAAISGAAPNTQYTFNWTVSAGTISSGQGTPTITLDTTGLGGQNIQVTVEVGGVTEECARSESCGASVSPPSREPHSFDQYADIKFSDEKARLDNFAIQLEHEPGLIGYIVTYASKHVSPNEARRKARRAKRYVVNRRGIEARRVVTIYGGRSNGFSTVLWALPGGAEVPKFGQVIK